MTNIINHYHTNIVSANQRTVSGQVTSSGPIRAEIIRNNPSDNFMVIGIRGASLNRKKTND